MLHQRVQEGLFAGERAFGVLSFLDLPAKPGVCSGHHAGPPDSKGQDAPGDDRQRLQPASRPDRGPAGDFQRAGIVERQMHHAHLGGQVALEL